MSARTAKNIQQGYSPFNVITLLLLHPLKRNPVQSWSFESESVIRIGRSTDNHVILYSAVVSRHHVELRQVGNSWEIVNLGTNGTYLDGKRITKVPVVDGAIIRLARSGPNIQIRLGTEALKDLPEHLTSEALAGQRIDHHATVTEVTGSLQGDRQRSTNLDHEEELEEEPPTGTIPVPPHLRISPNDDSPSGVGSSLREPISVASTHPSIDSSELRSGSGMEWGRSSSGIRSRFTSYADKSTDSDQPLQAIGDYEIQFILGQGDIGITYLAHRDGQPVILKTLNGSCLNNPKARAALEVEAELLNQLDHPHIPDLIDFFVIEGQPYLVMQKMEGPSLAQTITSSGALPLPSAIAHLLKICDILSYLHQFVPPVLHRNIEPANVICQPSGELALISFGAIKSLVMEPKSTVGSNGYAAPNQLSISATPQVDLYSLGPTLAFLLTGQNPVSFCKRDGAYPYQFMADAVPNLAEPVAAFLRRLTHVNEEQHYPSVEAVVDALRSLV